MLKTKTPTPDSTVTDDAAAQQVRARLGAINQRLGEADVCAVVGPVLADRWKDRPDPAPEPAPRRPAVTPGRRCTRPGWLVQLEYRDDGPMLSVDGR